jgi:NADPH:quinone reductase-like Zn-dependent oxidoreductase
VSSRREFAVGEEVFGTTNARFVDGYSEYAMASAKMIARKPSNLSAIEAASMPVVAVTAWQMLFDHAHAQEGHTVFIQGAEGNVGAYALQLALWRKMRVVAGVRDGDIDRIRRLGASEIIDMRTANSGIRGQCADVVIDTVGGSAQHDLFSLLKPGGILVSVVSPPDARATSRTIGLFYCGRQHSAPGPASQDDRNRTVAYICRGCIATKAMRALHMRCSRVNVFTNAGRSSSMSRLRA